MFLVVTRSNVHFGFERSCFGLPDRVRNFSRASRKKFEKKDLFRICPGCKLKVHNTFRRPHGPLADIN